ncbi:MAG: DUF1566 domain-containing protein [Alphaproteobacteria bacterium]
MKRSVLFVSRRMFGLLFCFMVMMILSISDSYAQEAVPGNPCTTANATRLAGGVEASGVGYYMVCQGGVWVRIFESDTKGVLKMGGEAIIGTTTGLACSGTTEGAIRYDSGNGYLEYCNGSSWESIAAAGSCDNTPHSYEFTDQTNVTTSTLTLSDILLITGTDVGCNVAVSVSGGNTPNFRVCADSLCSSVVQDWTATNTEIDMNGRYLQIRDTSSASANTTINVIASVGGVTNTWSVSTASSGACGASPTIGQTCSDGTVYAGISPDGNVDMYVARCDIGMTWNGSNCTGIRSFLPWNNGNTTGMVETGYQSNIVGEFNTAGIIVIDSDSITEGVQPHQAAQACADLNIHDHTDWYLPAPNEAEVIYKNLQDGVPEDSIPDPVITGFATTDYWTSREQGDKNAYHRSFNNGFHSTKAKENFYAIRCARQD